MPDPATRATTPNPPGGEARPARRFKTRGLDWWTPPPETALNSGIPYVVQIAEDALSPTEYRVLKVVTDLANGATKQAAGDGRPRGRVCDPGGYTRLARLAGVCRKTAYNSVRALVKKGFLRVLEVLMKGRQRVKTVYFARYYGDVLADWRADQALFHTTLDRVVVRTRARVLMSTEEAARYNMDPKRAPKRGSGRGLSEFAQAKAASARAPEPAPLPSDAEIAEVYAQLQNAQAKPNLADAIDLIRCARAEASRIDGGDMPARIIAQLTMHISADYKRTREHPFPKPGWFLTKMPGYVGDWIRLNRPPETRSRTG